MAKTRGRPPSGIQTALIRVRKEQAKKLKVIATLRETTSASLLGPLLQPFIEREYPKAIREASARSNGQP